MTFTPFLRMPYLQKVARQALFQSRASATMHSADVLHPESKQQTTPAAPRDALECVAALARTREDRQNCVRFAYL